MPSFPVQGDDILKARRGFDGRVQPDFTACTHTFYPIRKAPRIVIGSVHLDELQGRAAFKHALIAVIIDVGCREIRCIHKTAAIQEHITVAGASHGHGRQHGRSAHKAGAAVKEGFIAVGLAGKHREFQLGCVQEVYMILQEVNEGEITGDV